MPSSVVPPHPASYNPVFPFSLNYLFFAYLEGVKKSNVSERLSSPFYLNPTYNLSVVWND